MAWFYLILGGFFEMGWTVGLKLSQSMQPRWLYIAMAVLSMSLSLFLLYLAQRTIAIDTSYVDWTGIGAVGTVLLGIFFFHDSTNLYRLLFVFLILTGVVGLKLVH